MLTTGGVDIVSRFVNLSDVDTCIKWNDIYSICLLVTVIFKDANFSWVMQFSL